MAAKTVTMWRLSVTKSTSMHLIPECDCKTQYLKHSSIVYSTIRYRTV